LKAANAAYDATSRAAWGKLGATFAERLRNLEGSSPHPELGEEFGHTIMAAANLLANTTRHPYNRLRASAALVGINMF
jgi:hypothetical protein